MCNRDSGFKLIKKLMNALCRTQTRGFSVLELMIVVAIFAILTGIAMPRFTGLLNNYRRDAATQQLTGDVRRARTEAIRTGWQYRIFGFNSGATSAFKNQYRIQARRSGAVAWPGDTVAAFQSSTQIAGAWVDFTRLFPGVTLNPDDDTERFWVSFDARGVRIELDDSFDPLYVVNKTGASKLVNVATVGSVKIQ
jgi:prepilin-type N-terminal cleavage/methylation domain-containing protein